MLSPVQTIKGNKTPLLIIFGLVLLAKAPAFLGPLYSVDAWIAASAADDQRMTSDFNLILSQYRFGLAALFSFFRLFEFNAAPVAFSSVFLAFGFTAAASLFAYLTIDPEGRRTPYLIFAAIFCLHPFTTEIFTFVDVTLFVSLSLAGGLFGTLLVYRSASPRDWIVGGALLFAALSIYQVTLHFVLITLLFAGLASLVRGESLRPAFRGIAAALLSAAACLLIGKGVNAALGIPSEGRGALIGLAEIPDRIVHLRDALVRAFVPPARLIPAAASLVAGAGLIVATLASLVALYRRAGIAGVLLGIAAFASAAFWVAGLSIAGKSVWLVPRVLCAVAAFLGGALALGWLSGGRIVRGTLVAVSVVLGLAYVASNNRILYDQWRINRWDAQQANRILARLEDLPEFPQMKRLAIQGGFYSYSALLPTAFADLNMSSLAPGLFKNYTIRQTTGYDFAAPSPNEAKSAAEYCASAPKWPAAQSVRIIGGLGIVCLGQ